MIEVRKTGDECYEVTVRGPTTTTHQVTLTEDYYQKLTGGREPAGKLIERSFGFLLRHEPNTSILRRFDLQTSNRYFPDFEKEIGAKG